MVHDFLLPDLGEGLEEATIVEWLVSVGDHVVLNQPICVVETAKAAVELPAPYSGRIVELRGSPGETLEVGALLVRFDSDTADEADNGVELPAGVAPVESAESKRTPTLVGYGVSTDATVTRPGRRWGRPAGDPPAGDEIAPRQASGSMPMEEPARPISSRPLAKPPVRKLARELGVDLGAVNGSGSGGVITREDVRALATLTQSPAAGPSEPRPTKWPPGPAPGDVVPLIGIRARIAQRMSQSRSTIPEATCGRWVDFSSLVQSRDVLRASLEDPATAKAITPFALVMRFLVLALRAHPILNASPDEEAKVIRVHHDVHLGIATNTANGLIVPVVPRAQSLSTIELALGIARLAAGARAGTLGPNELIGSTFTVTNFGALGLDDGNPVINYPDAAILGIGSIKQRPTVVDGDLAVRTTAKLICSFDHRVCDGGEAGGFLATLSEMIEQPAHLLLHV